VCCLHVALLRLPRTLLLLLLLLLSRLQPDCRDQVSCPTLQLWLFQQY
jgi:hypothetical protein